MPDMNLKWPYEQVNLFWSTYLPGGVRIGVIEGLIVMSIGVETIGVVEGLVVVSIGVKTICVV